MLFNLLIAYICIISKSHYWESGHKNLEVLIFFSLYTNSLFLNMCHWSLLQRLKGLIVFQLHLLQACLPIWQTCHVSLILSVSIACVMCFLMNSKGKLWNLLFINSSYLLACMLWWYKSIRLMLIWNLGMVMTHQKWLF